ncbi:MAG TPA: Ig-like domain-containing protein, partial [Pyrinomonadaceae bacterium]|nr:Ig-like domain-containing protein [Pyrinomonadaceae bacterium]
GSPTPDGTLVSSNASQGSCKFRGGSLYCKLGTLAVGASATVVMVIKPYEGIGGFPREGKMTATGADVGSREVDNNAANNSVTEMTLMLPDPNLPPQVEIESPKSGAYLVRPTALTIDAKASDPDGTVDTVEFFDNGKLIGAGSRSTANHFTISVRELQFGRHVFGAVATDNKGRQNIAGAVSIIVNGSARVEIVSPLSGSVISPGTNLTLTASARPESGILKKVEFFANDISLGEGAQVQPTQYSLRWPKLERGSYSFVAVATDGSEVSTTSAPIMIKVSTIPKVSLVRPAEAARFPASTNLSIIAKADQGDEVKKVDLYANGKFIGHMTNDELDVFRFTWRSPQAGLYVLTAVATNPMGVTGESAPVKIILVGSQRKN